MPDEKIDKAKGVVERFSADLRELQSYDSYRVFILKYFTTPNEIETMLSVVALGELSDKDLANWNPFVKLFKLKAYREFARKVGNFQDEGIRLGLLQ